MTTELAADEFHSDTNSEEECNEDQEGEESGFNMAGWAPGAQEYGIFNLLIVRSGILEAETTVPPEMSNIKVVETSLCKFPPAPPKRRQQPAVAPAHSDDDEYISEGEHGEHTGPASWPGKPGSWWRVHNQLGEDLLVREGVSLKSTTLRTVPPGELVQQAGLARSLMSGGAKGCIRLPVRPAGWVTADATRAGGPKYLVRASVPHWRVVYAPDGGKGKDAGVIVRETEELVSEELKVLHRGDVVEQAGPVVFLSGIVRMPVTANVIRRSEMENGDYNEMGHNGHGRSAVSGKTYGWVTVDASAAGGPVFFKTVADADRNDRQQPRRRRPKAAA